MVEMENNKPKENNFDNWLNELEKQPQPEPQACSIDDENCEACGA